jgi:hypothetical protein
MTKEKNEKTINKIKIVAFAILIICLSFFLYLNSDIAKNTQNTKLKEEVFKKDEYCRVTHGKSITDELITRWGTNKKESSNKGYSTSIKEIFFSPTLNQCVYSYELLFSYGSDYTTELVIARAPTGDILFDEVKESSYEVDKNKNFTGNIDKFEIKINELKGEK